MIASAQPITIPHLTIPEIKAQIETMPQLSKAAINLLDPSKSHFSKAIFTQKIDKLESSTTKLHQLEADQCYDRSRAIGCCALNILFGVGLPLSIGLVPNLGGQLIGAIGSAIAYGVNGSLNKCYADNPEIPFIPHPEDGEDACLGFCFGPCFAAYEASHQIPLRIDQARNSAQNNEDSLRREFQNLLQFAANENAVNEFQSTLLNHVSKFDTKIAELAATLGSPAEEVIDSHAEATIVSADSNEKPSFEAPNSSTIQPIPATRIFTPQILQRALKDTFNNLQKEKEKLEQQKGSMLEASKEINAFVQYFKEKNPS